MIKMWTGGSRPRCQWRWGGMIKMWAGGHDTGVSGGGMV